MAFDFCYEGQCFHLETTKDGEVHCEPIGPEPQEMDLEPSSEGEQS